MMTPPMNAIFPVRALLRDKRLGHDFAAKHRRRWRRLLTVGCVSAVVLCTAGIAASQTVVAGVALPERTRLGGSVLALVSCGVRDTLWIDHYVAALYLPIGLPSIEAMHNPKKPKVIVLQIVGTALLPEQIPEPWRKTLSEELRRDPLARVRDAYHNLAVGDRVRVTYTPDVGLTMAVNDRVVARTSDHALIDSMLRAWAEKDPISGKLNR